MSTRNVVVAAAILAAAVVAGAENQVWNDGGADNVWSTNVANWADGTVWTNGNSAIFSGGAGTTFGEIVDISATVTVANVTFQTNGYVIADADNDGLFLLAGAPSLFSVVNSNDTATVSRVIGGAGGLTKAGGGVLNLTTNNAYTGTTTVSAGILRLARGNLLALGQVYAGTDTVVAAGATLDLNGAYVNSPTAERFTISGAGTDGKGALVNKGADMTNRDLGWLTLLDDAMIGGPGRIDCAGCTGNNKKLTKSGTHQLCMKNVANVEIVINEGLYTLLADNRALGGTTPGNTTVNGGTLNAWNTMTVPERITFNGGNISQGNPNMQLFTLSGYLTVNSNVNFTSSSITNGVEISGYVDGPGGFTQTTASWCYFTGNTNSYTGPTVIRSNCPLYVGKTNLYSGVLGYGAVTNSGTLYGYSPRLCHGPLVNWGTVYCNTGVVSLGSVANGAGGKLYLTGGLLGTGSVANSGNLYCYMPSLGAGEVTNTGGLYFDGTNLSHVVSNAVYGSGSAYIRYGSSVTLANYYTNANWRVGMGTLTLTNGATVFAGSALSIADRQSLGYSPDPSNVVATLNIRDGASLTMAALSAGNGSSGCMTGIVNQTGGSVLTTGWTGDPAHFAGEYDGVHLGHYPAAYTEWNISGGTLTVDNGYRFAIAIDGTGVLHQTGGQVYCQSVVVNARDANPGGSGRLTLEGGVLNVGSNGITAGVGAGYLVQYGGMGGIVRAMTNFTSSLNATLFGSNANAITFDTTNWAITLSGKMTGAGGFNKRGTGDLVLSGTNTFSGPTRIMEGAVVPSATYALSTNSVVVFGVAADGTGGTLRLPAGFSLAGLTVGVANPEDLDEQAEYVVATWSDSLGGMFGSSALPGPWYVYYDWENRTAKLRAAIGTVLKVR